jgi:hypothetical protein
MEADEHYQQQLEHQQYESRVAELESLIRYHSTMAKCLDTEMRIMKLGISVYRSEANVRIQSQKVPF